jgi:putative transposase
MPRTLRLAYPGAWHHVMNRGLGRRVLFTVEEDRDAFLGLLTELRLRWGIEVHAAALMTNHYHLLLRDPDGLLSRGMRHLNGVYTQSYNRRHGRDGPLMRGRFRARLVQSERYLAELVRYIHANPVDARLVDRARDYPWSSHRHYLDDQPPEWLETREVFARFGGDTPEGRAELDRYVHERQPESVRAKVGAQEWSQVLGDPAFEAATRHRVRQQLAEQGEDLAAVRGPMALRATELLTEVAEVLGVPAKALATGRRGQPNEPRRFALLLCADHLSVTAREVAGVFGLCPSSVPALAMQIRRKLAEDVHAQERFEDLKAQIQARRTKRSDQEIYNS